MRKRRGEEGMERNKAVSTLPDRRRQVGLDITLTGARERGRDTHTHTHTHTHKQVNTTEEEAKGDTTTGDEEVQ